MSISKSIKKMLQELKRDKLRNRAFHVVYEDRERDLIYKATGRDPFIKETRCKN